VLTKKKYLKNEVQELLNKNSADYEKELLSKNELILNLKEENRKLSIELDNLKQKDELVLKTLALAEEKKKETEELIQEKYELEISKLKFFVLKWQKYFEYLQEKYPYYKINQELNDLKANINLIFNSEEQSKDKIKKLGALVKNDVVATTNSPFNPKEKIDAFIQAENGFDINEVLNPGELDLEDLCKELGLMD